MIRPITADDATAVVDLAVASELFPAEEAGIVRTMMAEYFGRTRDKGHLCVLDDGTDEADEGGPFGVAYYEPAVATDRTWYLTMIGVRLDRQRRGFGSTLLTYVEDSLAEQGQRLLLVETSGLPAFERARGFYRRCGYDEEARVRDYYGPGDDMVLFRKAIA